MGVTRLERSERVPSNLHHTHASHGVHLLPRRRGGGYGAGLVGEGTRLSAQNLSLLLLSYSMCVLIFKLYRRGAQRAAVVNINALTV